jgi:hypothetical protein
MIRLFDYRLGKCALHACIMRQDKPNFDDGRERTPNRRRSHVALVLHE